MVDLSKKQYYKVTKALLSKTRVTQLQLHRELNVSLPTINKVVKSLAEANIVDVDKRLGVKLKNPIKLLDILAFQRPKSKLTPIEIRLETSSINEGERIVADLSELSKTEYVLTGLSALSRYIEYFIGFSVIHLYSYERDVFIEKLPSGRGDITVCSLLPDNETVLKNITYVKDAPVVDPVQVVIDLFCLDVGRDGAMKLLHAYRSGKIELTH